MVQFTKVLIVALIVLVGSSAHAKDLTNRLGLGYSDQFSTNQASGSLPSMQAQYYPNPMTGLSVALGVDTEKDNSRFGLLFKLYRIIFTEANANFYMGGGASLLSVETTVGTVTDNRSGFELTGFIGVEYFFTGLESVGFSFEAGVGIRSDSDGVRFRTVGDHPLRAGIIFYF